MQMDGRTDRKTVGLKDRRRDSRIEKWSVRQKDRQTNIYTDRRKAEGNTESQMDGNVDRQIGRWMHSKVTVGQTD